MADKGIKLVVSRVAYCC